MSCVCTSKVKTFPWNQSLHTFTEYENILYGIYCMYYEESELFFDGKMVCMKHYPPDRDKKSGLMHIIYENLDKTGNDIDRTPELDRCLKVTWGKHIIDFHTNNICQDILIYEEENRGDIDILLYSKCLDYMVVLSDRTTYYLLKTAYPIKHSRKREQIYKQYDKYINKNPTKLKTPTL